ncbi:EAL domain-containing protein [Pseudomonas sp. CC120222-01a]|uniref:EAL domain-containing protein n=1 Tax=Pseudomonas sp. CC120222-01a TaxID=1378075 RepID=UPI000D82DFE7|nr:EAL domain-containing protein [Pseudomonas sp. CC120222-01a]PVZ34442.1 EAL domain-containing protein (putative c-di-GMP-specific phosphodiesterase class I) [Pseudomonas sp. CC120222-01a]
MTVAEQLTALSAILAQRSIHSLFQPIVRLSERRVFGHEALSRGPSNSPLHSPLNLFAIARQSGHLTELEAACRESACRRFSEQGLDGKLFLNISPESLLEPHYPSGRTLKLLEQVGLAPSRVVIELTEHTPTDDFQLLSNALHHYRDMGFSIALDDLGAGYSSLRLWSELRPEYVKIDRHFIDGIHRDPLKREFVGSILQIARASKAQVIAEGIELAEELAVLTEMGVDLVQGYLLGRPQELGVRESQQLLAQVLPVALVEQPTVGLNATLGQIMELFGRNGDLKELDVLDADGNPCGVIHRDALPLLASSRARPLPQKHRGFRSGDEPVGAGVPAKRPAQAIHNPQACSG